MKMRELYRHNVPEDIIALWERSESDKLLPVQELVVRRHDLFGNGNLLIQAPTSSGKTFVAEMAAIQSALRRKKVVYLVPLKALAEEKYRDFEAKYTRYGLRVIISTRDRREFDRDFEDGRFSIAVVVYEKLAQLLVRRPERMAEVDLVLADELEILSDTERGSMAELLLTRVRRAGCRLIGLSAVIGGAEDLAQWMDAQLVYYERRPVELRFGVLYEGTFRYRTYNEYGKGEETLIDAGGDSAWEMLTQNVCTFAQRGEACLVFVKARHEARRGAQLLAQRTGLPAASDTMDALRGMEATRSRALLLESLAGGVAFHNTDLSPGERHAVEEGFRRGEVRILISTSTLAVGLNLPAQNVFIAPEKWRYDERLGMPWKTPILHAEYENMGGRAGRYGAGHPFGRSILVAATPFDRDTLWQRYVDGQREPIQPRLAREPLENHVLRLVASRACRNAAELLEFLEATLSGQWVWSRTLTLEEVEFRIRAAVNRCTDAGVVTMRPDGLLEATPLGLAVAAKGISLATTAALEHWIGQSETRAWCDADLILTAAMTSDGRMLQVGLTAAEYERADYPSHLRRIVREEEMQADVPLNRLRNSTMQPFFEDVRAVKVTLMIQAWLEEETVQDIEERCHTMAGQVLGAAAQISWIIDAASAIAATCGADTKFVERLHTLAGRVQWGVNEAALPLAQAGLGLSRGALLDLAAQGWSSAVALADTPIAAIKPFLGEKCARRVQAWARENAGEKAPAGADPATTAPKPPRPVLVIDDDRPGELLLEGKPIRLQEMQYRLIRALAARPGACVPYDEIYAQVWGDTVVENNQMHFQKRNLLKRITEVLPHHGKLITTTPKRGFTLQLAPEEVVLAPMREVSAA